MNLLLGALAVVGGIAIAIQAAMNARLAEGIASPVAAALVSFLIGATALLSIGLARGGIGQALAAIPAQPAWSLIGGLLGGAFLLIAIPAAPRLGVAVFLVLVVAGQMLASSTIDHFGWLDVEMRPITWFRAAGVALVIAGATVAALGEVFGSGKAGGA